MRFAAPRSKLRRRTPVSVWIEGRYHCPDTPFAGCGDCDIDIWSSMIGVRVFLDAAGTTQQEHDRMLPWETHWNDVRAPPTSFGAERGPP